MSKTMASLSVVGLAVLLGGGCSRPDGGSPSKLDASEVIRPADSEIVDPNGQWRLRLPSGYVVNPYEPVRVTHLQHIRPSARGAVTFGLVPRYSTEPPTGPSAVTVSIFRIESSDYASVYQPLLVGAGVTPPSSTTVGGRAFWSFQDPAGEQPFSYYVIRKGAFTVEFQVQSDALGSSPAILNELWGNLELAQ